ncbi:GDT1-like protein 1, chloroplastic [Tanacetum coccineum]
MLMRITNVEASLNPNVTATLKDNSNFRLINETNKRVLWESFDHPTDVLLLGIKLGEAKYKLTSVYNNTVGYFSYNVDQDLGSEHDDGPTPMWHGLLELTASESFKDLHQLEDNDGKGIDLLVIRSHGDYATKLTRNAEDWECSTSNGSCSKNILTRITSLPFNNLTIADASWNSYLKFMFLFGILTFQDAQNALAGSDVGSLVQSSSFFGDLGDIGTGFASALLAARNSAAVVFTGTFSALGFGDTDLPIDDIAAALLLVYFGVSMLLDATSGDGLKAEEEQKEAEIAVSEVLGNGAEILAAASTIVSTFLLVFVAEWGDKSFFSTILDNVSTLSAASSPIGVIGGALMTTTVVNNSVFRGFFEKQKLSGPNFIGWYIQLRIVLSTEDKLNYLELPIPVAPVPAVAGQQVPPETLAAHAAWVKGQKEIDVLMLMTMEPDLQWNLENLGAYDMLKELKTLFAQQAEHELL